jgi:hypothetical protein
LLLSLKRPFRAGMRSPICSTNSSSSRGKRLIVVLIAVVEAALEGRHEVTNLQHE